MSQVCRYYQRGNCRNGQNCNFLHPGATTAPSSNPFGGNAFAASQPTAFGSNQAQTKLGEGFNVPTTDSIKTDLLERPTWYLSSYGPGKDPPVQLIDGRDISPEETRILAYKLRAEGNPAAYEAEWNRLTTQAQSQIAAILNDLPGAVNFIKTAYQSGTASRYRTASVQNQGPSTFGGQVPQQAMNAGPSSPFGQVGKSQPAFGSQGQTTSAFGTGSPFAARPAPAFGQSAFSQPPSQPSASPAFGQPAFGSPAQPHSSFGRPAFGQPAFGEPAPVQPAVGQTSSPLGAANTPAPASITNPSPFGQPSGFGAASAPRPAFGQAAFGQPAFGQSAFGQKSPFSASPGPFSQAPRPSASSPFAQATSPPAFSQTPGNQPGHNANPFSTTQQGSNVFQTAAAQAPSSPFSNSNPFQQPEQAQQNQQPQQMPLSPFQSVAQEQPAPPFGQPSPQPNSALRALPSSFSNQSSYQAGQSQSPQGGSNQINQKLREQQKGKKWDDPVIEFMPAEVEAFASPSFTLGHVPTVAPSREMCWG